MKGRTGVKYVRLTKKMNHSERDSTRYTHTLREPEVDLEPDQNISHADSRTPLHRPAPEAVKEQLGRLLASPRFASSPRCQILLSYVVEKSLKGDADSLKERNIGIEVFKRDPAYDTNADPTVRVAASEIRKKLAQYYYEPSNQDQLRIELPTGSYAPVFSLLEPVPGRGSALHHPVDAPSETEELHSESASLSPAASTARPHRRTAMILALAACVLLVGASIPIWRAVNAPTALQMFWAPVLKSSSPALICPGLMPATQTQQNLVNSSTPPVAGNADSATAPVIAFTDAVALADIVAALRAEKKPLAIRDESSTSFEDLQKSPVVLLGSFVNHWTIYLTRSMPYHFVRNTDGYQWIADQKNPEAKIGVSRIDKYTAGQQEFGLVARIIDSETKQPIIIVAGVTPTGTLAAGLFVSDPQLLSEFLKNAPKGWQTKNMEVLLSTNVIDNQPGPPRVVASSVW